MNPINMNWSMMTPGTVHLLPPLNRKITIAFPFVSRKMHHAWEEELDYISAAYISLTNCDE